MLALAAGFLLTSCFAEEGETNAASSKDLKASAPVKKEGREIATLGAGCFWCIEAVLEQLEGVDDVVAGYMGGQTKDPTYKDICRGDTGHVQVVFDPKKVSFDKVLSYFWKMHDPTTLNRQGNDVGTQYRSVIFYHSDEQRAKAEAQKKKVDEAKVFEDPVVTEISKAEKFYPAEKYHQDYYRLNKSAGYCRYMIAPKLDKLGLAK